MKNILVSSLLLLTVISCNNNGLPDVSDIKINVKIDRFERDFFGLDTNHLIEGLQYLTQKYPGFTVDFINNILGLNISGLNNAASPEAKAVRVFIKDYRPLKDSCDKV
ncbi:MAG: hypothetical protein ABIN97_10890, partial [Ginsengibacter sp.]